MYQKNMHLFRSENKFYVTTHPIHDVSFSNSTASTWTLATPRTVWELHRLFNGYAQLRRCLHADWMLVIATVSIPISAAPSSCAGSGEPAHNRRFPHGHCRHLVGHGICCRCCPRAILHSGYRLWDVLDIRR